MKTIEDAKRETKMDCREMNPTFGGRDLSFLKCQIGDWFAVDQTTHAPRFRLVAFGYDWNRALELFHKRKG